MRGRTTRKVRKCAVERNDKALSGSAREGVTQSPSTQEDYIGMIRLQGIIPVPLSDHQNHFSFPSTTYMAQESEASHIQSLNLHGSLAEGRSPNLCTGLDPSPIAMIVYAGSSNVGKRYFLLQFEVVNLALRVTPFFFLFPFFFSLISQMERYVLRRRLV
jgi:hypothetical protein